MQRVIPAAHPIAQLDGATPNGSTDAQSSILCTAMFLAPRTERTLDNVPSSEIGYVSPKERYREGHVRKIATNASTSDCQEEVLLNLSY